MSLMDRQDSQAHDRLALLLAGGGRRCRRLVAAVPDDRPVLDELAGTGAPSALLRSARDALADDVSRLLERLAGAGWRWLVPGSPGFPALLGEISDPPLGLFVRGRLKGPPAVAVVGSRAATSYGRQVARLLGEELARAGVTLVSGMARGVDAAAHEGALSVPGDTWAVWGTGPDRIYPPEHGALAERIVEHGALLTEYLPGTPPRRHHFPERNRLLAGMAAAVVVVEAAVRSGALITARQAVDEGREVFAVPGSIFSDLSIGPNALIRMGARPLLGSRELLDAVGAVAAAQSRRPDEAPSSELLQHLPPGEALSVDEWAHRAGITVHELLQQLLELELSGAVERGADGSYSLVSGNPPGRS
jgi:DNA processing protein